MLVKGELVGRSLCIVVFEVIVMLVTLEILRNLSIEVF